MVYQSVKKSLQKRRRLGEDESISFRGKNIEHRVRRVCRGHRGGFSLSFLFFLCVLCASAVKNVYVFSFQNNKNPAMNAG